jgi:hypothetical protein
LNAEYKNTNQMPKFYLPRRSQSFNTPQPVELVTSAPKKKSKLKLSSFFRSKKARLAVAIVLVIVIAIPTIVITTLYNQSQVAEASSLSKRALATQIVIEDFNNINFHRSDNSNITVDSSTIRLNNDTCNSQTQPTDTACRLLFYPQEQDMQADLISFIKSINLNTIIAKDSLINIEHVDSSESLISKLGQISSQDKYSEINVPISFANGQAIRLVFWNQIIQGETAVGNQSSSGSKFGRYCNIQYTITNPWSNGYNGNIRITNPTSQTISDWDLTYELSGSHKIESVWNGKLERNVV